MNTPISFTLSDVAAICALIVSVGAVIALFIKLRDRATAPDKKQDERITQIEKKLADYDRYLDSDKRRIEALEQSIAMNMKCQFALLSHAINGNDIDKLKSVQDEMQKYLSEKGVSI